MGGVARESLLNDVSRETLWAQSNATEIRPAASQCHEGSPQDARYPWSGRAPNRGSRDGAPARADHAHLPGIHRLVHIYTSENRRATMAS